MEKNKKDHNKKIAEEFISIDPNKLSDNLYIQGNFENHKFVKKKYLLLKIRNLHRNTESINSGR